MKRVQDWSDYIDTNIMIIMILSTFFVTLRCETKSSKIMLKYPNTSKSSNKKTQRQENLSIQSQDDALNFNVLFKKSDIYIESYNVVGGIVSFFSFLSGTMASATQRFFSFALEQRDFDKLKKIFSH
jgi:hypothetical protein